MSIEQMNDETKFLYGLFRFARWVTFATGSCGAMATVVSFLNGNVTTGILYLVGTSILYSVSTFFMLRQRRLRVGANRNDTSELP